MEEKFDIDKTNICKGIAICLMIIHHLFWNVPGIGFAINDVALSQRIGIIGKVCVSIYLILSGIGIFKSDKNNMTNKQFYIKRITKLYIYYIFIVLTSTIIGILFFKDELIMTIGYGLVGIKNFLLTCTGVQYIIGYQGFNGAWWYMSVAIICYFCYPFIKINIDQYGLKFIIISFIITFLYDVPIGRLKIFEILSWIFPFIIGIYVAKENIYYKIKLYIYKDNEVLKKGTLFISFFILVYIRQAIQPQSSFAIKLDYLLAFIITLLVYLYFAKLRYFENILIYLGKHSMNIYFIHMFITTYFIKDFIYSLDNPIIMFFITLSISLLWSNMLNLIKKYIKLDIIVSKIETLLA